MTQSINAILALPVVTELQSLKEMAWFNPHVNTAEIGLKAVGLSRADAEDAEARLQRFAPLLAQAFPETADTGGIIESDMVAIPLMQAELEKTAPILGQLWIKKDSHLPISGSIKARGGIYEVLFHAEQLALAAGLITPASDYRIILSPEYREFFSQHKIAVGFTGNLGLSIGIMSAKLGFQVTDHMSVDAR